MLRLACRELAGAARTCNILAHVASSSRAVSALAACAQRVSSLTQSEGSWTPGHAGHAAQPLVGARFMSEEPKGDLTWTPPPDASRGATADLCDVFHPNNVDELSLDSVKIMEPIFSDFGGNMRFSGPVSTIKCFENNPLVRQALSEPGEGRVLLVDGGASKRCALLGDNLAEKAYKNGWTGVIVNGCIRDSQDIETMPLGVKALSTYPLKSSKRDPGFRDVPVIVAGVRVEPGDWIYADKDGVIVAKEELKVESE